MFMHRLKQAFAYLCCMGRIVLQGMAFTAYVGVHDFEQEQGNRMLVDVELESPEIHSDNDMLSDTIDYAKVYQIVAEVMQGRFQLIETVAQRIMQQLQAAEFPSCHFTVRVSKLNPPFGGPADRVFIELKS